MKKQTIQLCWLTIFSLALFIAGCGGGSDSSDYTLSPEQLEVTTVVEVFAAAIQSEKIADAMIYVDSNLTYPNETTSGYSQFKKNIENLFAKAEISKFTITGMGVNMVSGEDVASVRALLTLEYSVDGKMEPPFSEKIELYLERTGKQWGIIQFTGYNELMKTSFPPAL